MTQNYTPVAWQDETTSQQGTLINAERLNQMQTAHHFVDGFEEVDAIPTADPGVDYHKVVYCTADSTIYRWDGTEWTADIDDETKALLLEHEADHDNPHQVTKAQVGLGNCDNTSDLNKPISTAAQTALNAKADKATTYTKTETDTLLAEKADKATTLAGYGITDAYTKSQADSLLADKADKADTYDKTAVDGLLAGKVDKLISSPAGTYKSVTVNAQGQVTAGTNPTTLAGYGITDAYTKTETDTLLALKADQATTYTKSEVQTYVSNALDGYLPMVRTTGNQTIAGAKTFSEYIRGMLSYNRYLASGTNGGKWVRIGVISTSALHAHFKAYWRYGFAEITSTMAEIYLHYNRWEGTGTPEVACIHEANGTYTLWWRHTGNYQTVYICDLNVNKYSGGSPDYFTPSDDTVFDAPVIGEGATALAVGVIDAPSTYVHTSGAETIAGAKTFTGTMLATGQRAYSAGNTTDVATIGTLDAYTPMVRTTGNQEIIGIKAFSMPNYGYTLAVKDTGLDITNIQAQRVHTIPFLDKNGVGIANIRYVVQTTGEVLVQLEMRKTDGTFKYVNLGDNN